MEVAPNATPPVCKLMDYGKYKYELKKTQAAKKQKVQSLKEIKLRPNIGIHDLNVKMNHIRDFLENGHKTRVRIFFRGREIVHPELGRNLANKIYEELKDRTESGKFICDKIVLAVPDNNCYFHQVLSIPLGNKNT